MRTWKVERAREEGRKERKYVGTCGHAQEKGATVGIPTNAIRIYSSSLPVHSNISRAHKHEAENFGSVRGFSGAPE